MHQKIVTSNTDQNTNKNLEYLEWIKNNKLKLSLGLLLLTAITTFAANPGITGTYSTYSNEITYRDPVNHDNYITFNHAEHTFFLQQDGQIYSGPYSETSQAYNINGNIGTTIKKIGTDEIEVPNSQPWVKQ